MKDCDPTHQPVFPTADCHSAGDFDCGAAATEADVVGAGVVGRSPFGSGGGFAFCFSGWAGAGSGRGGGNFGGGRNAGVA